MKILRTKVCCAALLIAGIFGVASPVLAHHSFTMFDITKRLTLAGTVTSFEWTNPHAYIEIDVPDDKAERSIGALNWAVPASSCKVAGNSVAFTPATKSR
jgi:hypothetical protein